MEVSMSRKGMFFTVFFAVFLSIMASIICVCLWYIFVIAPASVSSSVQSASDRQRTEKIYDAYDESISRSEKYYAHAEEEQQKMDKILNTWEKQQDQFQKFLDSIKKNPPEKAE
jgi:predicted PurR-regulated permease PerM